MTLGDPFFVILSDYQKWGAPTTRILGGELPNAGPRSESSSRILVVGRKMIYPFCDAHIQTGRQLRMDWIDYVSSKKT